MKNNKGYGTTQTRIATTEFLECSSCSTMKNMEISLTILMLLLEELIGVKTVLLGILESIIIEE